MTDWPGGIAVGTGAGRRGTHRNRPGHGEVGWLPSAAAVPGLPPAPGSHGIEFTPYDGKLIDGGGAGRLAAGMTVRWQAVCVDAVDPEPVARFWELALAWRRTYERADEIVLEPPAGSPEDGISPDLLVLRVPEEKSGKNRLHIDLRPTDQAAEVARLESLGAVRVDVGQGSDKTWVVMADPAGNEFCVLRALTAQELAELPG